MPTANAMVTARVPLEVKQAASRGLMNSGYSTSHFVNLIWSFLAANAEDPQAIQLLIDQAIEGADSLRAQREKQAEDMSRLVMTPQRFSSLFGVVPNTIGGSEDDLEALREEDMAARYFEEA